MINLKEKSIEELTNLEVKCKEAQKSIFTDIANCKKDSPEYNLLKTDFEKYAKLVVEIENEKKLRKENEEKKETLKKENTKTKKENDEKEKNESNDSKSEIENEKDYKEYKETYTKLIEELKKTKKIGIPKTVLILAAETFVSGLFWTHAPIIFSILVTVGSIAHIASRIKKRIDYEIIRSDARYLKKEIDKYENKEKKKVSTLSKLKGLFNFKTEKKKRNSIKSIKKEIKANKNKKDNINEAKTINETEIKNPKTTSEKIEELKNLKQEVNEIYGLKKDQIIQDRVNVREICNFYHTNNTNPSYAKTSKEKVMVKK